MIYNSKKNSSNIETIESLPLIQKELCTFDELPLWAQDNQFIVTGYRPPNYSFKRCLKSLFFIHNETGNIYSHFIGVFIFLGLIIHFIIYISTNQIKNLDVGDYLMIFVYCFSALFCFITSALFHTFLCHSEAVSAKWNKCDYLGIVFFIIFSQYPLYYFMFTCDIISKYIYLSFVTFFGCLLGIISFSDYFRMPKFRLLRTILFISLGLFGAIPIIHLLIKYKTEFFIKFSSIIWSLIMGILYIVGGLLYGFRFPESRFPGKVDIWGHSHQLFHIFVVFAAICHYISIINMFYKKSSGDLSC